jgi:hypothetical protein
MSSKQSDHAYPEWVFRTVVGTGLVVSLRVIGYGGKAVCHDPKAGYAASGSVTAARGMSGDTKVGPPGDTKTDPPTSKGRSGSNAVFGLFRPAGHLPSRRFGSAGTPFSSRPGDGYGEAGGS